MERKIGDYWKEQEGSKTIWKVKGFNNVVTFFYHKRDAKALAKDLIKVYKKYN